MFGCAVKTGAPEKFLVVDMPIHTYDDIESGVSNAKKIVSEIGADAVKIEGKPEVAEAIIQAGIKVMGHVGLLPQTAEKMKVQDQGVLEEAKALDEAGVFAIVLECVPADLGMQITEEVSVPTIGIGAGVSCDGQVLVTQDMLGMNNEFTPKFLRKYGDFRKMV